MACLANSEDSIKFNAIISGFDYSNNTSSFGRYNSAIQQPSYSLYASFFSKKGFNVGVSGYTIGNTDSTATKFTQQCNLNLGYDLDLSDFFSLSMSYTHFLYSKNSFSLNSIYRNEFSTGINFNRGKFYNNASIYYLSGNRNEIMNTVNFGFNFDFKNIFLKNHTISISPDIGAIWSNQDYYNQYAYKNYWYLYPYALRKPFLTIQKLYENPELYPKLWNFLNNRPRRFKEFSNLDKNLIISELFQVKSKYTLSSVSFSLPVYYNVGNFSVNLTYSVTLPLNVPDYLDNSTIHNFSAGVMYNFVL